MWWMYDMNKTRFDLSPDDKYKTYDHMPHVMLYTRDIDGIILFAIFICYSLMQKVKWLGKYCNK